MIIQKPFIAQLLCVEEKGLVALISVLIIGSAALTVSLFFLILSLDSSKTAFSFEQSSQAKALADACSEEALQQIRDNISFSGSGNLSLSQGNCSYAVINNGGESRTINSTGEVKNAIRKVKITISAINPRINISYWQDVAGF